MIRFDRVEIEDFGVLHKATLPLDDQGLVLIRGENFDTDAADSNGSGKTTLFKAMTWALFGKFVGEGSETEVIRKGAKRAAVTVHFRDDLHQYRVRREREKSARLSLWADEVQVGGRTTDDIQGKIENILGLDWLSFKNTVLYGQGDIQRFADPGTNDADRKAVLKRILRLEVIDAALGIVKDEIKLKNAEIARAIEGVRLAEQAHKFRDAAAQKARMQQAAWEENRSSRLRVAEQVILSTEGQIGALRLAATGIPALEAEERRLEDVLTGKSALEQAREAANAAVEAFDAQIEPLQAQEKAQDQELLRLRMGIDGDTAAQQRAQSDRQEARTRRQQAQAQAQQLRERQRDQDITYLTSKFKDRRAADRKLLEQGRDAELKRLQGERQAAITLLRNEYNQQLKEHNQQVAEISERRQRARKDQAERRASLQKILDQEAQAAAGVCPTCGSSSLESAHWKSHREGMLADRARLESELARLDPEVAALDAWVAPPKPLPVVEPPHPTLPPLPPEVTTLTPENEAEIQAIRDTAAADIATLLLGAVEEDQRVEAEADQRALQAAQAIEARRADLARLQAARDAASATLNGYLAAREAVRHQRADLTAQINAVHAAEQKLKQVRLDLDQLRRKSREIDPLLGQIEVERRVALSISQEQNPHLADVAAAEAALGEALAAVGEAEAAVEALRRSKRPLEFWEVAFGNKGLPSILMDDVMPMLTEKANHYLGVLTDGDIRVQFSTSKPQKGDATKIDERIQLTITIEGLTGVPASGGQRSRINLAVDLALMDLVAMREGVRVDLLLLDEVLDGLDGEGHRRVVDLLRHLRGTHNSIFVIAHDASLQEHFERVVTVRKERGGAELVL